MQGTMMVKEHAKKHVEPIEESAYATLSMSRMIAVTFNLVKKIISELNEEPVVKKEKKITIVPIQSSETLENGKVIQFKLNTGAAFEGTFEKTTTYAQVLEYVTKYVKLVQTTNNSRCIQIEGADEVPVFILADATSRKMITTMKQQIGDNPISPIQVYIKM